MHLDPPVLEEAAQGLSRPNGLRCEHPLQIARALCQGECPLVLTRGDPGDAAQVGDMAEATEVAAEVASWLWTPPAQPARAIALACS